MAAHAHVVTIISQCDWLARSTAANEINMMQFYGLLSHCSPCRSWKQSSHMLRAVVSCHYIIYNQQFQLKVIIDVSARSNDKL